MSKAYNTIDDYFEEVINGLAKFQAYITSSQLTYDHRTSEEGTISGSLTFIDKSQLFVREYIYIEQKSIQISTYRFHWQDKDKKLIVRWDNAPHHRGLKTFPHHKHVPGDRKESSPKSVLVVVEEICRSVRTS